MHRPEDLVNASDPSGRFFARCLRRLQGLGAVAPSHVAGDQRHVGLDRRTLGPGRRLEFADATVRVAAEHRDLAEANARRGLLRLGLRGREKKLEACLRSPLAR